MNQYDKVRDELLTVIKHSDLLEFEKTYLTESMEDIVEFVIDMGASNHMILESLRTQGRYEDSMVIIH